MKLGNTSQSIVGVPDFFLIKDMKSMDVFTVSKKKQYFRESDLFKLTKDLNLCNNPRNNHRKFEEFNKKKYVPVHKLIMQEEELNSSTNKLHSLTLKTDPGTFANFRNFMERTNVSNYTNPNLKEEIKQNIGNLLDRINSNYDVKKWTEMNTKPNFNVTIEPFSALTLYNSLHESETSKFRKTLNEKIKSLSYAEEGQKEKALKKLTDVDTRRATSNGKNISLNTFNGKLPTLFSTERSLTVKKLINDNKDIYDKYKETSLFREFPSPNRSEYLIKRGEKISKKRKKPIDYTINADQFNANKSKSMFCEKNSVCDGFILKFHQNKTLTFT